MSATQGSKGSPCWASWGMGDKDAQNALLSAQGLQRTPRAALLRTADILSARVFPRSQPVFNEGCTPGSAATSLPIFSALITVHPAAVALAFANTDAHLTTCSGELQNVQVLLACGERYWKGERKGIPLLHGFQAKTKYPSQMLNTQRSPGKTSPSITCVTLGQKGHSRHSPSVPLPWYDCARLQGHEDNNTGVHSFKLFTTVPRKNRFAKNFFNNKKILGEEQQVKEI